MKLQLTPKLKEFVNHDAANRGINLTEYFNELVKTEAQIGENFALNAYLYVTESCVFEDAERINLAAKNFEFVKEQSKKIGLEMHAYINYLVAKKVISTLTTN